MQRHVLSYALPVAAAILAWCPAATFGQVTPQATVPEFETGWPCGTGGTTAAIQIEQVIATVPVWSLIVLEFCLLGAGAFIVQRWRVDASRARVAKRLDCPPARRR